MLGVYNLCMAETGMQTLPDPVDAMISSMLQCGYTYNGIQRQLGVGRTRIAQVSQGVRQVDAALSETATRERVAAAMTRADYILDSITEEDVKKASLKDKAIAWGIIQDKIHQATAGSAKEIHQHVHLSGALDRLFADVEEQKDNTTDIMLSKQDDQSTPSSNEPGSVLDADFTPRGEGVGGTRE